MDMQAVALVMSAVLSVCVGGLLAKQKMAAMGLVALALLAFWAWFNGGLSGSVQVLHAGAGMLLLAASGVCLAHRSWLSGGLLALSVGVVWVGSYYRMRIPQWVQGGNDERLHWFQLLGNVTAWGLLAVGAAVLLAMWVLARKIKA